VTAVSDLDLRLLRIFTVVAESGGFSSAQCLLNVSQSTISSQMSALEERLGYKVCQRGRAGFKLTEKGQALLNSAAHLFNAIDAFQSQVSALRTAVVGEIKLGISEGLSADPRLNLSRALRRFSLRSNFNASVCLQIKDESRLQLAVLNHTLHAAIGSFTTHSSQLHYLHLYDERMSFYVGVEHPLYKSKFASAGGETNSPYGFVIKNGTCQDCIPANCTETIVDSNEAVITLVLSGLFIGRLPTHYAQRWLEVGKIREVFEGYKPCTEPIYLATKRLPEHSPALAAFLADLNAERADGDDSMQGMPSLGRKSIQSR